MSLLAEIREAAVDGKTLMSTLLRKCAVLAARLDNTDFQVWVNHELNGYPDNVALPEYRVLAAPANGHLAGPFGSGYQNITIPVAVMPEGFEEFAKNVHLHQPISAVESLAAEPTGGGELSCPWPGNLIGLMQLKGKFAKGLVLYGAWQNVGRAQLVGLIDTVRNRVLDLVLKMERDVPEAGESSVAPAKSNDIAQQFITNIYGDVANFANASPGAVQTSTHVQGELTALIMALTQLGVPQRDADELVSALKEEDQKGEMGPKTSAWLSRATRAVKSGAWKLGTGVTAQAVVKLVTSYLGLA